MSCKQYMLDLSGNSAIPSQYMLGLKEITKWIHLQTKGYEGIQVTREFRNRGCYIVQTSNDRSAEFLATFSLEIKVGGKAHSVPLRRRAANGGTRVRLFRTCEGAFADVPNSYFDDVLTAAGCVIVNATEKGIHENTSLYDGMRYATVDRGTRHLEREHEYVDEKGNVFRWRLEYAGQPHHCFRGCGIFHEDGKCPEWQRRKDRRAMEGQQKCFVVTSSMFRLATDTKTTNVAAIPGAKIGHVANHVNNDTRMFAKAEVLVVAAGANMDLGSVEASKPQIELQAQELTQVLQPMVEASKKSS